MFRDRSEPKVAPESPPHALWITRACPPAGWGLLRAQVGTVEGGSHQAIHQTQRFAETIPGTLAGYTSIKSL